MDRQHLEQEYDWENMERDRRDYFPEENYDPDAEMMDGWQDPDDQNYAWQEEEEEEL